MSMSEDSLVGVEAANGAQWVKSTGEEAWHEEAQSSKETKAGETSDIVILAFPKQVTRKRRKQNFTKKPSVSGTTSHEQPWP